MTNDSKSLKELHIVQLKYWMPVAGGSQLFATSKEDAINILTEAHKDMKDFEIVDVTTLAEIEAKQAKMLSDAYPSPDVSDETTDTEEVPTKETVH